jgi:hypothetical protein
VVGLAIDAMNVVKRVLDIFAPTPRGEVVGLEGGGLFAPTPRGEVLDPGGNTFAPTPRGEVLGMTTAVLEIIRKALEIIFPSGHIIGEGAGAWDETFAPTPRGEVVGLDPEGTPGAPSQPIKIQLTTIIKMGMQEIARQDDEIQNVAAWKADMATGGIQ